MLPDFVDLKLDISDRLEEFVRERKAYHLGHLSKIRRVVRPEGGKQEIKYSSGESDSSYPIDVSIEFPLIVSEIPTMTLDNLLEKLDNLAKQMAEKEAKFFYQRLFEILDKFGQTTDAKGRRMSAELILESLSSIRVEFDRYGRPQIPPLIFHPTLEEAVRAAYDELENNKELKAEWNSIIEQKRNEWIEREGSRKLVG